METGLILLVPEAGPVVADLRARLDPNAALNVPAHVTALYPFRAFDEIDEGVLGRIGDICRRTPAFDVAFARTGRFPGVLWLAPDPREPIDALTAALAAAFPDCPPYAGRHADPEPHLTVAAQPNEARLDRAERALRRRLLQPLRARIESCALYVRRSESWCEQRRFALG